MMLKAKTAYRPDRQLEKILISLVYSVVAMAVCLLLLFAFPQYSLPLLGAIFVTVIVCIALAISVLNASEEALTYGGFANEILNSPDLIKRIDNNIGEPIIENVPAQKFFQGGKILEELRSKVFQERENLLNFQKIELAVRNLKKECVVLNLINNQDEEWYEVSVRPLYLKKNDIFEEDFSIQKIEKETYFLWKLKNITASKNMEKIFEKERKNLHHFINEMPIGIYIANINYKIEYANQTFADQLGMDKDEIIGKLLSEVAVHNKELFDPKRPDYAGMSFFAGKEDNVEMFVRQSNFYDGTELKICGTTLKDLPNDKQLLEDFNKSADEIATLIGKCPYGIIVLNKNKQIEQINLRAEEILELPNASEKQLSLADVFEEPTVKLLEAEMRQYASSDQISVAGKIETRLKSDKVIRLYTTPRLRLRQSKQKLDGMILYIEDTTEQKSLEFKFAQAQKMQAMGQLAGGIAHDFNNLLTAMIGFCDLLLQRHGIGDPSFADLIQIKQNANRAAGLVRQLLAFSRQQPLKPKQIDVTENFMELSHLMKRILGEQIVLDFNHGRDLGFIKVDPVQFSQVIINLAVNAKDAMNGKGRLSISTSTERLTQPYQFGADVIPAGDFVVIRVTDTGCGIPKENLSRIFEPFFSTKQNVVGSGTGLGLAMVYGIVRQTEGFIKVDSVLGEGTTFSIYLPRFEKAQEEASQIQQDQKTASVSTSSGAGSQKLIFGLNVSALDQHKEIICNPQEVKILFVEDEDSVRTFAVRALRKKGFAVTSCASAEKAVEILDQGETFNLMITDMVMPGMSGTELAAEIKKRIPDIKIILASGYSEEIVRRELKSSDGFEFIAKPYSLGDLSRKVSDILEGKSAA